MQTEQGAIQGLVEAFGGLSEKLNLLNSSLSTLECAQLIKLYKGDPKQFKDWVKSIEKCAYLAQCPADRVGLLAFKTSRWGRIRFHTEIFD